MLSFSSEVRCRRLSRRFNALRNALGATGREQCIVVVVNEFDEISTISKKEMLSYGWEWIGVPEDEEE